MTEEFQKMLNSAQLNSEAEQKIEMSPITYHTVATRFPQNTLYRAHCCMIVGKHIKLLTHPEPINL